MNRMASSACAEGSLASTLNIEPQCAVAFKAVKHGFIHFYSPVAVVARANEAGMSRSSSWPMLPDAGDALLQGRVCHSGKEVANVTPSRSGEEVGDLGIVDTGAVQPMPRTPSTACPSQWSAGSPRTPGSRLREVSAPIRAVSADAPSECPRSVRRERRVPFGSLRLPEWAMEIAAKAPVVENFSDVESWYSSSPSSTPLASPRAPVRAPLTGGRPSATAVDGLRPNGAKRGARWADLAEDDDGAPEDVGRGLNPERPSCREGGRASMHGMCLHASHRATIAVEEARAPRMTRWADMVDEDERSA